VFVGRGPSFGGLPRLFTTVSRYEAFTVCKEVSIWDMASAAAPASFSQKYLFCTPLVMSDIFFSDTPSS